MKEMKVFSHIVEGRKIMLYTFKTQDYDDDDLFYDPIDGCWSQVESRVSFERNKNNQIQTN